MFSSSEPGLPIVRSRQRVRASHSSRSSSAIGLIRPSHPTIGVVCYFGRLLTYVGSAADHNDLVCPERESNSQVGFFKDRIPSFLCLNFRAHYSKLLLVSGAAIYLFPCTQFHMLCIAHRFWPHERCIVLLCPAICSSSCSYLECLGIQTRVTLLPLHTN